MQLEQWLVILILVIPLALVMFNRLRIDLAAMLMAVLLGICQLAGLAVLGPAHTPQDAAKAISGFSQSVVITLISLFILTRGLEKSGVTRWIAQSIVRTGGSNTGRLIALFAGVTALLSLFMNNVAAGALMLPSAMEVARRTGVKPSKLLIPVAYGSLLGGSATYFTTANIIMSDLLRIANPPQAALRIYDFAPAGGLIAVIGIVFLWLFGNRLMPNREPSRNHMEARLTGSELEDLYQINERLWSASVMAGSPLIGCGLVESEIGKNWGVTIAAVQRSPDDLILPVPDLCIRSGDQLLLIGREERIDQMHALGLAITPMDKHSHLSARGLSLAEVILAPHSSLEGKTLKEIALRRQFGVTALALKHLTRSYRTDIGDIPLAMGDTLLILGPVAQIRALHQNPDVLIFEPDPGDQPIHLWHALLTSAIVLAAIGASIAGVPVFLSMLAGAVVMLMLNLLNLEEAYRSVEWPAIFLVAGMYAVSLAMVQTGLAGKVGAGMLKLVAPLGGLGLAGGAFLVTALLTQFMGGQVSALITGPVVISAAISMGINPQAVAVATAIGCSASYLTPMAHPVNILMIAPGNYKFSDFFRAGWGLMVLSFLVLLAGMVIFWGL